MMDWFRQWREKRIWHRIIAIDHEVIKRRLKVGRFRNHDDYTNEVVLQSLIKEQQRLIQNLKKHYHVK